MSLYQEPEPTLACEQAPLIYLHVTTYSPLTLMVPVTNTTLVKTNEGTDNPSYGGYPSND